VDRLAISDVHAYLLCSVAMNLRLSQVVNEPMITVTAALPKSVLPGVKLY
jgi:acetamidase/formamidase